MIGYCLILFLSAGIGIMKVQYDTTEQKILEAFMKLMRMQSFSEISVSSICKEAGISRTTFYKHYQNQLDIARAIVRHVLIDNDIIDMEASPAFLRRTSAGVPASPVSSHGHKTIPVCEFVRSHSELHPIFADPLLSSTIVSEIAEHRWQLYLSENGDPARSDIRMLFYYQGHGCLAVLRHSFNSDEKEWKNKREIIDHFIVNGMKSFLQ